MGGPDSGRWLRWNSKSTTEAQYKIDIRWMKRQEYLRTGNMGLIFWSSQGVETGRVDYRIENDRMVLNYRYRFNGGEWESVEQSISFDRTPCNYGGYRQWFRCPKCWRRIGILYGTGKFFLCRHCYGLTYQSQQESKCDRLMRKARKIRQQLGGGASLIDPFPNKPKNMHWRTYLRLRAVSERANYLSLKIIGKRFGIGL